MTMQTTPSQDKLGFQGAGFDWNNYIKYRPKYPPNFFDRLYEEHAKNLNSFETVNDVGAGAGVASELLAEKFKKVIVSEPNHEYLKIAEKRLNSLGKFPKDKFIFLPDGGEKSSLPDASIDCLTICVALHWTDIETSINEFARILKPGGTLGIYSYPPPKIRNDPVLEDLRQELYSFSQDKWLESEVYARAFHSLSNGFQNVYFDPKIWKAGVQRVYINTDGRIDLMRTSSHKQMVEAVKAGNIHIPDFVKKYAVPPKNNVGKTDVLEWIEGDRDWYQEVDADYFENNLRNMVIGRTDEFYKNASKKLREAIGDRKVEIYYSVIQIIATRL